MILKSFKRNTQGRDFVVGDMHGCYDAFMEKLEEIKFHPSIDRMFSVGDLVDRGKQNMDCLRLIEEPWFHAVRGNHEDMMLDSVLRRREHFLWERNGGVWTHEEDITGLEELCKLAEELPLAMTIETGDMKIGICHANPPSDWDSISEGYSDYMRQTLTWSRSKIHAANTDHIKNIDYVICGHTPVAVPVTFGNVLYIDTGACFKGMKMIGGKVLDGWLTCLEFSEIPAKAEETQWPKVKAWLESQGKSLDD